MPELHLGDLTVDVVFKNIKNVHLSVYPPTGRVRISAPSAMPMETVRLFAISRVGWIRKQQRRQQGQARETPREYLERESHELWGRRYLLRVIEGVERSAVQLSHRQIELHVPTGADQAQRAAVLDQWYRQALRAAVAKSLPVWEQRLGVTVERFFIQRIKTQWGGSRPETRTIRLNLELAKKDRECLEYVLLHELAHFQVSHHGEAFVALLDQHMPNWRQVKQHLNALPLGALDG
jgi:predicted metal-dependent hydrolase